ncbi:MAG TPA: proline dehydrogenase family protein, partial [Candidatus Dormibacteraeota bacterium]|nr:proline dehydrogenase family protein [Candidatus Dormibacteraeota bacterium]
MRGLMEVTRRGLLWLSDRPRAQRLIAQAPLTGRVAGRFVAGEHTEDAIRAVRTLNASGLGGILNLLGEGVVDRRGIDGAMAGYREAIAAASKARVDTTVTIKPSQIGVALDPSLCEENLRTVAAEARAASIGLEVDMEHSELVEATVEAYLGAGVDPLPRLAVQAALHRTPDDVRRLSAAGVPVRLVKGAYLEPSQVALQNHADIDAQYAELASSLLERGHDPAFGTHDTSLIKHVIREARRLGRAKRSYEFQMLYGIRRDV